MVRTPMEATATIYKEGHSVKGFRMAAGAALRIKEGIEQALPETVVLSVLTGVGHKIMMWCGESTIVSAETQILVRRVRDPVATEARNAVGR